MKVKKTWIYVLVLALIAIKWYVFDYHTIMYIALLLGSLIGWSWGVSNYIHFQTNGKTKKMGVLLLGLVLLLGAATILPLPKNLVYRDTYEVALQSFTSLETNSLERDLEDPKRSISLIYVSDDKSELAKDFVPKLEEAARKNQSTIYFIDGKESSPQLEKIKEKYQIESLPALLKIENGELVASLAIIEELEAEDIIRFLNVSKKDFVQ